MLERHIMKQLIEWKNKKPLILRGARAREYEDALNWLNDADVIHKINNITKPAFPLNAYNDLSSFKIYMLDARLIRKNGRLGLKHSVRG